jgi:hypothetical protein
MKCVSEVHVSGSPKVERKVDTVHSASTSRMRMATTSQESMQCEEAPNVMSPREASL